MKNVLRRVLLLSVGLLFAVIAFPQNRTLSGRVTDEKGNPVAHASILVKGSQVGTSSDENGQFSLSVPESATHLTVSALQFTEQEVRITGTVLNIVLQSLNAQMDEVVVVGYGTQKITKISGAIATVKEREIEKLRPVRAEDAIQGRASGVTVISPGSPGAKPTVLIRGIPSYTGTDPVVVVDGSIQTLDDLNSIPAADIESINILKDAATTSIYGVKGGNGVILVTTKTGRRN
ncbi:MAG TPA: carboxypeptidase-like regulatory domain-containing protein, partial [Flavihumibacter sp.]